MCIRDSSGTGRGGVRYYYYACKNSACKLRVGADEIEGAVLDRLKVLASDPALLTPLVAETSRRLQGELPALQKRRKALARQLKELQAQADGLLADWHALAGTEARTFVTAKLSGLAERQD